MEFAGPTAFDLDLSMLFFFAIIVGGRGHLLGPVLGMALLFLVPNVFLAEIVKYRLMIYGGIALGVDRIAMLLSGEKSIREVIAFAKTTAAQDLMADSPGEVDPGQLDELGLAIKPEVKKAAE